MALEQELAPQLLVTFKSANMTPAHSPEAMLEANRHQLPFFNMALRDFVDNDHFHRTRGQYVQDVISNHHQTTKGWLLAQLPNIEVLSSIPISNSFLIRGSPSLVYQLSKLENVTEIHTNRPFTINLPKSDPSDQSPHILPRLMPRSEPEPQWNIKKIGATDVWQIDSSRSRGKGIKYAVADTGVQHDHPILRNNYNGLKPDGTIDHNYSWWDGVRSEVFGAGKSSCGMASKVPCDDQGHGTHVTSTAVGSDGYGVAPDARWIACRNMQAGVGSTETYLQCLNFFLAPFDLNGKNPKPELRPHVVGNSYGCPASEGCSVHAMTAAIEALRAAGVFMAVSAGNEGPDCKTVFSPPGYEPRVVSVGATDANDKIAKFSSRGPAKIDGKTYLKPNLSAPGVRILGASPGSSFRRLSGTSMAGPHAGGAAALISALCPCFARNVDKIQDALQNSAVPLYPAPGAILCGTDKPNTRPNNYFGYGRIDVASAVEFCVNKCGGLPK